MIAKVVLYLCVLLRELSSKLISK